ncbi:hypothetical protein BDK51DRAFT_34330 [Blyttiomyces helicus]|uniref:Uncharacterized protein n=1 Tax=Blyttiomyces helicus TaxID=388810 RepID=A0A4P9WF43_9FUNG|nr:hypothetical protein BDK51DRAFT_34330 [Blyttiomyces helicus]|eukprot:RKO91244.1 hypothetical protein BDK51DRAFT_34330 [Blyttiomyces helicus]
MVLEDKPIEGSDHRLVLATRSPSTRYASPDTADKTLLAGGPPQSGPSSAAGSAGVGMEHLPRYMRILDDTIGQIERTGDGTELEGPVPQDAIDRAWDGIATMVGDSADAILGQGTSKVFWDA